MDRIKNILAVTSLKPGMSISVREDVMRDMANADMPTLLYGSAGQAEVETLLEKFQDLHGLRVQYSPDKRAYAFSRPMPPTTAKGE